jgi:hypothetical protein
MSCDPGRFSQPGQAICSVCPLGTATYGYGSSECKTCNSFQISNVQRTVCDCIPGYYQPASSGLYSNEFVCLPCPHGADCTNIGTTQEGLLSLSGFWRADNKSLNFYRCQIRAYCAGGEAQSDRVSDYSGSPCNNNRIGVMCSYCAPGTVQNRDHTCKAPCSLRLITPFATS